MRGEIEGPENNCIRSLNGFTIAGLCRHKGIRIASDYRDFWFWLQFHLYWNQSRVLYWNGIKMTFIGIALLFLLTVEYKNTHKHEGPMDTHFLF